MTTDNLKIHLQVSMGKGHLKLFRKKETAFGFKQKSFAYYIYAMLSNCYSELLLGHSL